MTGTLTCGGAVVEFGLRKAECALSSPITRRRKAGALGFRRPPGSCGGGQPLLWAFVLVAVLPGDNAVTTVCTMVVCVLMQVGSAGRARACRACTFSHRPAEFSPDGVSATPKVKVATICRTGRRVCVGDSAHGSGINVGKDSRRAAWSTPSPIASVLPLNVRSARRRQERAHQRRWRRRRYMRSHPPHVVAGFLRWLPSGHLEALTASPLRATRQGPCRGVP
jgi:hypothetical protein